MGLPNDNYKGYVEADATQRARNVPSHSLYLLHGLADLSAPLQHGIALAKALADAGVIFRYQVVIIVERKIDCLVKLSCIGVLLAI